MVRLGRALIEVSDESCKCDHDALVRLQAEFDAYVVAHAQVHVLEDRARALALAALKSQTTLILGALGFIVACAGAIAAFIALH